MDISEQVNELRYKADTYNTVGSAWELNRAEAKKLQVTLREAADTIESLSTKLQAANMESDLIKREAVLKLIEDIKCNPDLPKNYGTLLDIMREVRKIPAAYDSENIIKANMERTAEDCGGWIADRIPTKEECGDSPSGKEFAVTVCTNSRKTLVMDFVYETVRGKEVARWKWRDRISPWEVIAWHKLPEPYHES